MTVLVDSLTILPLPPDFDAGGFSCGQPDVDGYLAERALSDDMACVTKTYIVRDGGELVAYVSVLCDAIRLGPEERPTVHPGAPALKIGLMGVRTDYKGRKYQGRTIGLWLLDWVVGLAVTLGAQAGLRYVTLDSLPEEKLVAWYSRYGFKENEGEAKARRIVKQWGSDKLKKKKLDEVELPHISMRWDIVLKPEPAKAAPEPRTRTA